MVFFFEFRDVMRGFGAYARCCFVFAFVFERLGFGIRFGEIGWRRRGGGSVSRVLGII